MLVITFIFLFIPTLGFSSEELFTVVNILSISTTNASGNAASPPIFLVLPFLLFLAMIATGPLFYEHFWHKNYHKIAIILATIVVTYYIFFLHNLAAPAHTFFEYVQFIALLSSLYIASGGIVIDIDKEGKPLVNVIVLLIGAVLSNVIGTTGASMLLIRPYIRLNKRRIQPYHIIFFIFIVSNIGGCLTPIGDPPLFLGFLKGVPFFWTFNQSFFPWLFTTAILAIIFYLLDTKFIKKGDGFISDKTPPNYSNKIKILGSRSFFWLAIIVSSVFLDPSKIHWLPAIIEIHGEGWRIATVGSFTIAQQSSIVAFSFVRETIMFTVGIMSYVYANKKSQHINEFNLEPIREVTFIFIGIFGTMMPALELVSSFASSPMGKAFISHNTLYWGTGIISGFLDNAPTYLNFLAAALAAQGGSINSAIDVTNFAHETDIFSNSTLQLTAISVASVFFGAMTYIGNGPNFMVKSIAEQTGVHMPSFFGYIIRFSIIYLLPVLFVVWLLFFAFA